MGSKKWTSALGGGLGLLTGDPIIAAIGAGVGHAIDKKHNKKNDSVRASAAVETEDERNEREKAAGEGGESPFDNGALGVSTNKKKLNTLVGGYLNGALSGSGEGSTTLG